MKHDEKVIQESTKITISVILKHILNNSTLGIVVKGNKIIQESVNCKEKIQSRKYVYNLETKYERDL